MELILSTSAIPAFLPSNMSVPEESASPPYSVLEMVLIAIVAGFLSILTVMGNILVLISFQMDKQLQTISNYFLLSLALADLSIGLISMPLFTMYLLLGSWPLGDFVCDSWLAFDYLTSNASVLNLLIISFDRYFSVTRPLSYRALRTTRRAAVMIAAAWLISLMLWPPWIYSWPYIEGERTVKKNQCYIQFLETNSYVTFVTALAAFYVPVTVMCFLYWRIWRETKQRQKDLNHLQAGKKEESTSSDDQEEDPSVPCVETKRWRAWWRRDEEESPVSTPLSLEPCSRTPSMTFRMDPSVYTILIRLPPPGEPSIKLILDDNPKLGSKPKHRTPKKKRKQQERKQEMKAAKTLSAILFAFMVTWTPYNVLVLYKTLSNCEDDHCIAPGLWNFAYYLCYINSTVNPFCYALCNANFRQTYTRILTCKWQNKRKTLDSRGFFA